jgi:hypothetical protein
MRVTVALNWFFVKRLLLHLGAFLAGCLLNLNATIFVHGETVVYMFYQSLAFEWYPVGKTGQIDASDLACMLGNRVVVGRDGRGAMGDVHLVDFDFLDSLLRWAC